MAVTKKGKRFHGLLAEARTGQSGVLAIVGAAGMGKSALISYAEQEAVAMRVLRARGVQSETQVPFGGLFELLRPSLGCLPRIPPPQITALESALALGPARAEDRFAIGAATLSLLAAYADTAPLLVVVDDAHWVDGSTSDALLFAFRRLLADPIAVIVGGATRRSIPPRRGRLAHSALGRPGPSGGRGSPHHGGGPTCA